MPSLCVLKFMDSDKETTETDCDKPYADVVKCLKSSALRLDNSRLRIRRYPARFRRIIVNDHLLYVNISVFHPLLHVAPTSLNQYISLLYDGPTTVLLTLSRDPIRRDWESRKLSQRKPPPHHPTPNSTKYANNYSAIDHGHDKRLIRWTFVITVNLLRINFPAWSNTK